MILHNGSAVGKAVLLLRCTLMTGICFCSLPWTIISKDRPVNSPLFYSNITFNLGKSTMLDRFRSSDCSRRLLVRPKWRVLLLSMAKAQRTYQVSVRHHQVQLFHSQYFHLFHLHFLPFHLFHIHFYRFHELNMTSCSILIPLTASSLDHHPLHRSTPIVFRS